MTLRQRVFRQMHAPAWPGKGLSPANKIITAAVLLSVALAVIQTERPIAEAYARLFYALDVLFLSLFSIEYIFRVWSIAEHPAYGGLAGRLRYMRTWPSLIDLLVIIPFAVGVAGADIFLIRLLRLLRIFALAKLGRFSSALNNIRRAVFERRHELIISFTIAGLAVFAASIALYLIEGKNQPQDFGSIPRALWWGIATLTTVGYGDAYPITPLGKFFAAIFAVSAIGLIAMPTGILAAAFSDAFRRTRQAGTHEHDENRLTDHS